MARPTWRVVVAEPDDVQRQLIDMLLADPALDLTLVSTGAEALEHLRNTTPDLCVLAMDLPDVSGDAICGKIRGVTRLTSTPVVLIAEQSGQFGLSDQARRRARNVGADLVLPRPLGDKNLRERLKAMLDARADASELDALRGDEKDALLDETDDLPHDAAPRRPERSGATVEGPASPSRADLDPHADAEATDTSAEAAPATGPASGGPRIVGPSAARRPASEGLSPEVSAQIAALRKDLEILELENAQLKRKLRRKQERIDRGVDVELERRVRDLERRNAALLTELEKRDEERGGRRRGRRS